MSAARRLALPLALRIFLLAAILVLVVAGTAVMVALSQGERIADRELDRALATSVAVQREFEQRRLEQLQFMVQQLAADASFVAYVADAQTLALGQDDGLGAGGLSVRDLLIERRDSHGFDLAMVMDAGAGLLARSDSSEQFAQDLTNDPLVGAAHDELRPFSGYWRLDGALFQAAIVPLQQDQDLVGFLLLALRVDDGFATRIAGVSGAQIAFLLEHEGATGVVASSLPDPLKAALPAALAQATPTSAGPGATAAPRLQLNLADQPWIAQGAATADASAPALGRVLTLVSTQASSASYRRILDRVLLAGLIALLLGLALSLLLAAGVLRPVRRLAEATESAAAGDYRAQVALPGRDQLARLSRAVDSLLASLREKNDIEGYLGQLTRGLPDSAEDGGAGGASRVLPRREAQVLLAVQVPALASADAAVGRAALAQIQTVAATADGRSIAAASLSDAGLLLAFAGAEGLDAALRALARILEQARAEGRPAPTAALHRGDTGCAGLEVGPLQLSILYGPAPALAARVLAQAPPGGIALTPAAAELCRQRLGAQATALARTAAGTPLLTLRPQVLAGLAGRATAAGAAPAAGAAGGPMPGSMLGPRYQVLSLLGTGGMGAVYKVRDLELDEIVALKMLRPGLLLDAVQLERLKDELRLARRITHPNVLRTFDFVEIDGRPCISMEYVRGTTLRWLLDASGTVPLSAGLRIARQLAAGLAAAHAVGVLHRDIKPENVILEASGTARLMDFGIARPIQRSGPGQTEVGSFVGTPAYCAPEQLAGEPVSARTDLYALGVLMCEMFGGKLPHGGCNTVEIYLAKSQQAPTPPSAHGAGLPPALESLIMACLAARPDDRPASAQAVLDALARIRA